MGIILTIVILSVIIGIFMYHDHTEWNKLVKDAISTQRCPFCGLHLHKFTYEDNEASYVSYTCPACEFCTSVKTEKETQNV